MDPFTNYLGQQAFARSKQNSDAAGFHYQWGQKEPRTFATSSLYNEGGINYYGKYPVKIYNNKSELIYQEDAGRDNSGKNPVGGVINADIIANSMMETIKKPTLFYGYYSAVINQVGQSKELWNYYWTSYSRGADGKGAWDTDSFPLWHNTYLDGYIVLRPKSIYDPCPYGYRTPANGTYNDFNSNTGWVEISYIGGASWGNTWFVPIYTKHVSFFQFAQYQSLHNATISTNRTNYILFSRYNSTIWTNSERSNSLGFSVRCIEDATVKAKLSSEK